jgi:glutamyl-tRNA reductase
MSSTFRAVSIFYRNAPAEIRERLSFDETATRKLLQYLRKQVGLTNVLVLSTSSFLEVYYTAAGDQSPAIVEALFLHKQMTYARNNHLLTEDTFTIIYAPGQVVQHLFQISAGSRRMSAGEDDVYTLLKKAYEISSQEKLAGSYLRRIIQTILLFRNVQWN